MIDLDQQIACVRRELALRENVYRNRVTRRAMTQELADSEIARMKAVLDTLLAVKWVLEDANYKAPEQVGEVALRWVERLRGGGQ